MKIVGNFYFELTNDGNLVGEFTNNAINIWNVESANYHNGIKGNFDCTYYTTWLEDKESYFATLKIITQDKTNYKLIWKNKNGIEIFKGEGKLENDRKLVGKYEST